MKDLLDIQESILIRLTRKSEGARHCVNPALLTLFLALMGTACSVGSPHALKRQDRRRLDVLTSFTLDLSKRDFAAAVRIMSVSDRSRMVDRDGLVRPEYRERLLALRLSTLLNNPAIKEEQGKIGGIYEILPVLAQALPVEKDSAATGVTEDEESSLTAKTDTSDDGRQELRKATNAFFKSVKSKNWNRALGMVYADEKKVFVKNDGQIRPGVRRRLGAIDTSSWEALELQNGKLTGIVLIIPDKPPGSNDARN